MSAFGARDGGPALAEARFRARCFETLPRDRLARLTGQADEAVLGRLAETGRFLHRLTEAAIGRHDLPRPTLEGEAGPVPDRAVLDLVGLTCVVRLLGPVIPRSRLDILTLAYGRAAVDFALAHGRSAPRLAIGDRQGDPIAVASALIVERLQDREGAILDAWRLAGEGVSEVDALKALAELARRHLERQAA